MSANTGNRSSHADGGASLMCPPELRPLLNLLLKTLADIDFEHESDVETVRSSSVDEWLKQAVIRTLQERHRERRAPYVRQLDVLQEQIRALLA